VNWDAATERVAGGDAEIEALLNKPYRAPWSLDRYLRS
jgi:hypothetical protein